MAAKGEFRADLFKNEFKLFGLEDDENSALAGLFIKVFKDTQSTRKAMASFDSLETLLPELGDMDAVNLARAALDRQQHGMGRVASECNYIEAQVHGPIVFARDVAEIVINKEFGLDQLPQAQKPWFDAVVAVLGGKQPPRTWTVFRRSSGPNLPPSGNSSAARVIPVRIEKQIPEMELRNTVRSEERAFYAAHLDQARIDAKLHDVQQDDAGLQAFISQMLSIGPGRAAVSRILGTVPLVTGGDAQNVREAFAAYVEQYRHVPLRGQYTEDDVLQDAMWQAVSDVMGKGRLDSLAAIEELTADPAQRATLRDFVMGHPP